MKLDSKLGDSNVMKPLWCPCSGGCLNSCKSSCYGCKGNCADLCTGCSVTQSY